MKRGTPKPSAATRPENPLREKLLEVAVRLLREEGIKALAQPRVAKEAGIPQGHLTYYFPKRSDLLLAVVRRTLDDALGELASFLGGADFARAGEDARTRALAVVAHLVENEERSRVLLGLLVESDSDPVLRETLVAKVGEMRAIAASLFGHPPAGPEVDLLIAALWGIGLQRLLLGRKRTRAETHALLGLLLDRFAPAPAAAPAPRRRRPSPAAGAARPRSPASKRSPR